jgi:hypothetical protein
MLFSRIKQICLYGNLHSARFLLATAETVWCISLFWPGDTFERPTYAVMAQFADETTWAIVFGVTAACQWYILAIGRYHAHFAVMFAGWNMWLWWSVVVSMYMDVYPPPAAISGELALAMGASWVYVRSGFPGRRTQDD